MFVVYDQNEEATNPSMIEYFKKTFPDAQKGNLSFGDFNVILEDGNIMAIERKTARDFLQSIGDGRVFRQAEAMHEEAKWCCIIVTGVMSYDKDDFVILNGFDKTNWRGVSVRGAIYTLMWAGCPVMFTDANHFPMMVGELATFCSKPDKHQQQLGHRKIITLERLTMSQEILGAFPGVGLKSANSLLEFAHTNADEGKDGSLAEAVSWGTSMLLIPYENRPQHWRGEKSILNFRAAWGLGPDQYLQVVDDTKGKGNGKK